MAVHVNEDVLFALFEVGQTCALRSPERAQTLRLLQPNRQKLTRPDAKFLLQMAVNKLETSGGKIYTNINQYDQFISPT
ncbi:Hypothetical predicted protein [Scomber scombrus]|uniref:Uncharacterized protein n=1 Tax=Scomber scombrus TaxID=13677 RepID=A0AAV1PU74_SCOSC